ncbi:MAG: hypothetical protein J0L86_05325 [Flavobacteriales bacterium]|nr:hypothetical protein [Flavobacteriales bacterium]
MKTDSLSKLLVVFLISFLSSCSDDDSQNNTPNSREVKYELTGNAVGTFNISYVTGSNTGAGAVPTALPWSKDEVAQQGSFVATMTAVVYGANPGQTITAKIYVGGVVKKEQTETVQSNGSAVISSLQYVLQ